LRWLTKRSQVALVCERLLGDERFVARRKNEGYSKLRKMGSEKYTPQMPFRDAGITIFLPSIFLSLYLSRSFSHSFPHVLEIAFDPVTVQAISYRLFATSGTRDCRKYRGRGLITTLAFLDQPPGKLFVVENEKFLLPELFAGI